MASATWNVNASGTWLTNANWTPAAYAQGAGANANFVRDITVNPVVTLNGNVTIGNLYFDDTGATGDNTWELRRSASELLQLDSGSASQSIINANSFTNLFTILTGSKGINRTGPGPIWFSPYTGTGGNASGGNTISGTFTQASGAGDSYFGGYFNVVGAGPANAFSGITSFVTNAGSSIWFFNGANPAFTVAAPVTGNGNVWVTKAKSVGNPNTGRVTFADLSGLTGALYLWNNQDSFATSHNSSDAGIKKWPTTLIGIYFIIGAGAVSTDCTKTIEVPSDATAGTTPVNFIIQTDQRTFANTGILYALYANQSTGAMTFTGTLTRNDGGTGTNNIGIQTFTFGGSSVASNTFSGVISEAGDSQNLSIAKVDSGRWILGGTNTYKGSTTISNGFLRATNTQAFGTVGTLLLSGGTLELAGVSPANTALNTVGTISVVSGTSTLTQQITMAGSTTFSADSGATLILNNTASALTGGAVMTLASAGTVTVNNQITAATGINKTGTGVATLSNTSNSFSGTPSISDGTLAIPAVSCLGAGTGLALSNAGTLKYTGPAGGALSRTITTTTLTSGGFENDSAGNFIVTGGGSITGTLKLGGTGTGQFSTLAVPLAAGGNGFTKTGAGRWIYTGTNSLIGTTSVTATAITGTLMAAPSAATPNVKLLGGAVSVGADAGIQIGSDNGQQGRNQYVSLTVTGTSGNRSRIRLGGSAVSPTIQMSGNLTLPASGTTTFDLSADTFKTPRTYTLVEFTGSGAVVNWSGGTNITTGGTLAAGRSASFAYDSVSTPKTLKVTIS